jgi:F5/8 type C domain
MHAFTTSCRRAIHLACASALCVACATYIDEPPNQGSPLVDAAGMSGAAGTAGSGAESPTETAGSGGSGGAVAGASGGMLPVGGSGGRATGGGGSGGVSGSGGQAGAGGSVAGASGGGGQGGAGGTAGAGGSASGGMGGKASGGSGGAGGSGSTPTCAKNPITAKTKWLVTASSSDGPSPPAQACDNMLTTRWTTGKEQAGGEWLQLDFGAVVKLSKLTLVLGTSVNDYPRKYATRFSNTPMNNVAPALVSGMGAASTDTVMTFPAGSSGRYVLINQSGVAPALWWSVAEIQAECAD